MSRWALPAAGVPWELPADLARELGDATWGAAADSSELSAAILAEPASAENAAGLKAVARGIAGIAILPKLVPVSPSLFPAEPPDVAETVSGVELEAVGVVAIAAAARGAGESVPGERSRYG